MKVGRAFASVRSALSDSGAAGGGADSAERADGADIPIITPRAEQTERRGTRRQNGPSRRVAAFWVILTLCVVL